MVKPNRSKKNKILRFEPNGLKTRDRSYNNVKRLLNKDTSNIRELLNNRDDLEKTLKEYLESKKYNVYLCKIHIPLSVTVIVSPQLLKPDLKDLKYNFGLNDYNLEIENRDKLGQYYFRWILMNNANEMLRSIRQKKALIKKERDESIEYIEACYQRDLKILEKEEKEWLEQFNDVPTEDIYKEE